MMAQRFTHADLRRLADFDAPCCISLYCPTHRTAAETEQDPIRFKNLLRQAKQKLVERGVRNGDADDILKPARELLPDGDFWSHQSDGLALFLAEDFSAEFRLPREFAPCAVVGSNFHVTPLVPLAHGNGPFYVLAISQKSCRLFGGDRSELTELEVNQLPSDLQSALGWWRERRLNYHSYAAGSTGVGTKRAMFHGQEEPDKNVDIAAYFRRVTKALWPVLRGKDAALIFAGVEHLFPIFKEVAGDLPLMAEAITGNPDRLSGQQLHESAWKLMAAHEHEIQQRAVENFHRLQSNSRATNALAAILPAAHDGLIETLLLPEGAGQPGLFDSEAGQVFLGEAENSEDIYNRAAVLTLRHNGDVLCLAENLLPGGHSAALLRVPLESVAVPTTHPASPA